ncbi:hypothetical protein M0805_001607 [Coniferiporia weirii]|nr:hypothetical protein M0805_001607 [Coniferiporia weirii]
MPSNKLGPIRPQSTFSTLRKESSAEDDVTLYNQRQNSIVPFTSSPFLEKPPAPPAPESEIELHPDELRVYCAEIPWSDLLLEIAMTTAFASLTDGTPILQGSSVASYLSFFAMVWWVWASQVAYNVRFRQSDWLHRIFVFLQLLIFCALAAFTNNFDVTNGILNNTQQQNLLTELQLADFSSQQDIAAANFRNNRLPTLNARGISLTMAFSRLVLLAQYALTVFHVLRMDSERKRSRRAMASALFVHIGSIAFSSVCYFTAYGVIGKNPSEADQIAKLFLWYCPLLIEVAAHFVAGMLPGRVRYPAEAIYERSSTVFIIILGGGLDKITNGFQFIVGNVSISFESLGLIICAAVIFILLFTLYFGTSEGDKLGSKRALFLFFFHFFYLSALIVTLQGIAAMLSVGNIGSALETPFRFVTSTSSLMVDKGFGVSLNESDYSDAFVHSLNKTGVALSTLLDFVNYGIQDGVNSSDPNLPYNYVLQADVWLMTSVLRNFNAVPDDGSLLLTEMSAFYDNDPDNYTLVNNATFHNIAEDALTTNATPALWFYAAGGSVLVLLGLMNLINRWPRDKYEWGQTISRIVLGCLVITFSAVDVHASSDILDSNLNYQGSRIWFLATHAWVLPPYALALIVEQTIELIMLYMAGRAYQLEGFSVFWRRVRVWPYAPTSTGDSTDDHHLGGGEESSSGIFDPYAPYDEKTEYRAASPTSIISPPPSSADFGARTRVGGSTAHGRYRQMSSGSAIEPLMDRV